MEPQSFLFVILIIFVILVFLYFYYKVYTIPQFTTLINLFIIFNSLLAIFTIYNTSQNYKNDHINDNRIQYDNFSKEVFETFYTFFITNVSMDYFFNEIYNNIPPSPTTERNEVMEELCCAKLMTNMSNYCSHYYRHIHMSGYKRFIKDNNCKFVKFFKLLFRSERFMFYSSNYLNKCGSKYLIDYFKECHLIYN